MRSGSSAFSELLASHLGKNHCFVTFGALDYFRSVPPKLDNLPDNSNNLYSTHTFDFLEYMTHYSDPLLIRCSRLDKAEQCLSNLFVRHINHCKPIAHRVHNIKTTDDANLSLFYPDIPLYISKKQVIDYVRHTETVDRLWKEKTKHLPTLTVYYEDLCNGIDIPEIDFLNCQLDDRSATQKLPNYKSHSIMNESAVREWVAELTRDSG